MSPAPPVSAPDVGQEKRLIMDKRRTSTNVRLVQTWDSTNVGPVQTSDQYKRRTKEKNI